MGFRKAVYDKYFTNYESGKEKSRQKSSTELLVGVCQKFWGHPGNKKGESAMFGGKNSRQTLPISHMALASLVLLLLLVQSCATLRPRSPLPQALEDKVRIPGFPDEIRAWADQPSESLARSAFESIKQERAAYDAENLKKPVVFLALSGGGDNGAFGAGVLCGWSAAGTRPPVQAGYWH